MNLLTIAGHIGRDAEIRQAGSTELASFSVATNYGFGDKKETVWVSCTLWGKRAHSLAPYIRKGGQISVAGEVRLREWQANDGTTKTALEMNVDKVTLMGGGEAKPAEKPAQAPVKDILDDDLPF